MKNILGLDLGTNSLGWAIISEEKIDDAGVIIFEQGIPEEKGVEAANSPAAERRLFRAARRLKYRRRLRKYHTLRILLENGMCPLKLEELQSWIRNGNFPIHNKEFIAWLNSTKEENPYYFRAKAAESPIAPLELGRAFYHIAIRRGFKSSRKDQSPEEGSQDKELGEIKSGIKKVTTILKSANQTLGQFLYERFQKDEKIRREIKTSRLEHYEVEFNKICEVQNIPEDIKKKLHTAIFLQRPLRSQKHLLGNCTLEPKKSRCHASHPLFERYRMLAFINSIKVRDVEGEMHPLNEEERKNIEKAFFVAAPYFKFEKIAGILFPKIKKKDLDPDLFNYRPDLSISSASLTHQLQKILECSDLLSWHKDYITPEGISKNTDCQTIFDAMTYLTNTLDNEKALLKFASERLGLDEEKAEKFLKINLAEDYANYSLYAIKKILPFLELGYIERYAVFLAKLPDIFGTEKFEEIKTQLLQDFDSCVQEYQWEKKNLMRHEKPQSLTEKFRILLEEKYKIMPDKFEMLYSFRETNGYADCSKEGILPRVDMGMIYNPMVQRSLTILRHLVNELRKSGKIDEETEIHLELAREVNNKNARMAYQLIQKENEKSRKEAIEAFQEYKIDSPTEEQILRYRLWKEQNELCLYTGRKIAASEIFGKNTDTVDIEHTIPRSRGGDSSMENLTLCDSSYNRTVKIGKLPSECENYDSSTSAFANSIKDNLKIAKYGERLEILQKDFARSKGAMPPSSAPERRNAARQKMLVIKHKIDYLLSKLKTFEMVSSDLDKGFERRQLVDTGVMSRHALQFLKSVYGKVYSRNGRITSFARQAWGIQNQNEVKDRSKHFHHAIDAMVLAALSPEKFSRIAKAFHEAEVWEQGKDALKIAYPWPEFASDVHKAAEALLIRHLSRHNETKQTKRNAVRLVTPFKDPDGKAVKFVKAAGDTVRGQLHEQTYLGCIKLPNGEEQFVVRKPLDESTFKSMDDFPNKIVDEKVAEALMIQMQGYLDAGESFKTALSHKFYMKTKSGNFDGPEIKRVRCKEDPASIKVRKQTYPSRHEYKNYLYARTAKGGNFLVALYRPEGTPPEEKRYYYHLISLWDWAKEHREKEYIPPQNRTDLGEFVGFVQPNVMVLYYENSPEELKSLSRQELGKRLYKVTEFTKDGRICLRHNQEARAKKDASEAMKKEFNISLASQFSIEKPYPLMKVSQVTYQNHLLFENIDFTMDITGGITFQK